MLPELILNCTALIADVVLKYPAELTFILKSLLWYVLFVDNQCFTKVVDDGLKSVRVPLQDWSLSFPVASVKFWKEVDCAKSLAVLYSKLVLSSASLCNALKKVDVKVTP